MTLFKCKGCNKQNFLSEHSLASHHQHRKQCKTLHYSIVLNSKQMSTLIQRSKQEKNCSTYITGTSEKNVKESKKCNE